MSQLLFGLILGGIIVLAALFNGLYVNKQAAKLAASQHPRKLTKAQREQFLKTLGEAPAGAINVTAIRGDLESVSFANELNSLFQIAGWPTQGVRQGVFSGFPTGLILTVNSNEGVPPYASLLQQTFKAIGLPASAEINSNNPMQSLNLIVGHKLDPL
jgi:hypothetical protein